MALVQPHVRQRRNVEATEPVATPRRDWTWLLLVLAAVAAVVALVASVSLYQSRPPGDSSAEAGFTRDMSVHHAQAVEMALIILDRTQDPEIKTLATDILLTQQGQIGSMSGWLDVWGLTPAGSDPPMAWMGHEMSGPMPGMATQEELDYLRSLSGAEADVEFLRLMTIHHEGALPMAAAIVERTDLDDVRTFAQKIYQAQEAEIELMKQMLVARGAPFEGAATPATAA